MHDRNTATFLIRTCKMYVCIALVLKLSILYPVVKPNALMLPPHN